MVTMTLFAVPARPGMWKTITLEDGSEISAEFRGDEFGCWWAAEDGRCFVELDGTSTYREVAREDLVAAARARRAEEARRAQEVRETQGAVATMSAVKKMPGGTTKNPIGEKKGIIILVNFTDLKFDSEHDVEYYKRFANEEGFDDTHNTHSVRDYFLAQSNGLFDLTFDVAGPVDLANEHAYYGHSNERNYPQMIREACEGAYSQGVDFSNYDWDGDGLVEQVFVIYAGNGAADTGDMSYTWPHKSELVPAQNYGGTRVSVYACGCELAGNGQGDGIGTVCHEYSHCMELPDAYDTETYEWYGMGTWSVMSYGSYNGNSYGYLPAGYTSYERAFCGWLDPIELTADTEVSNMKGLSEGGDAYIVYNQANENEFYMLENRTLTGFDGDLQASGLLVLHVDYSASLWKNNEVNTYTRNNDHERYTIIPADNVKDYLTESKDTWPYSGKNMFDNSTTPVDDTYNANSNGEKYMNMSLSHIEKASDGSISFRFYPSGVTPSGEAPEGAIFYESFDKCWGAGGNDGDFSTSVVTSEFYPDNDGWSCSTSHGSKECAMFGSNTQTANVLMPTFTISEETVLTFRAAPVTALVPGVLSISCDTGGISIDPTEIEIPQGEWTWFTIRLNGEGDVQLRLKETSGLNRFFLDTVMAMPLSVVPEGIETVESGVKTRPSGTYTLQGVKVNNPTQKGIYIVDGKKYVNK